MVLGYNSRESLLSASRDCLYHISCSCSRFMITVKLSWELLIQTFSIVWVLQGTIVNLSVTNMAGRTFHELEARISSCWCFCHVCLIHTFIHAQNDHRSDSIWISSDVQDALRRNLIHVMCKHRLKVCKAISSALNRVLQNFTSKDQVW